MWRIYYSDCTYEGNIEDAPSRDVQLIVQEDTRVGWVMVHQKDYYIWEYERWFGVDGFGLWDYLARPGWKKVLFGRTLTHEEWNEVYYHAKDARDFGRKEGFLPGERKLWKEADAVTGA